MGGTDNPEPSVCRFANRGEKNMEKVCIGDHVRFNPADPEMDRDDNAVVLRVIPKTEYNNEDIIVVGLSNGKTECAFRNELEKIDSDVPVEEPDLVNHPAHYNVGEYECIELIEFVTMLASNDMIPEKDKAYAGHLLGTWIKYLFRAPFKKINGSCRMETWEARIIRSLLSAGLRTEEKKIWKSNGKISHCRKRVKNIQENRRLM